MAVGHHRGRRCVHHRQRRRPELHLGPVTIGVGGFLDFLRVSSLGPALISLGVVVSWTTHVADIARRCDAVSPVAHPGPAVDDWAVITLPGVWIFPMLAEEFGCSPQPGRLQPPQPDKTLPPRRNRRTVHRRHGCRTAAGHRNG